MKQQPFPSPLSPAIADTVPIRAASALYGSVVAVRNALYEHLPVLSRRAKRPVISIGGIRAGGTGKTPAALLVGEYLHSLGRTVCFLSRGYRRSQRSMCLVAPGEFVGWESVGDEPALLHDRLPQSWLSVGGNRVAAADHAAPHLPADAVFLLDDGFQHRRLRRDLDIVCLHADAFLDRLLPSGYLREEFSSLRRAHAILLIGSAHEDNELKAVQGDCVRSFGVPSFRLWQMPGEWINLATHLASPPPRDAAVVCGIARPQRFLDAARAAGVKPSVERIFPDHYRYTTDDFSENRELYYRGVVTTEKDAIRLRGTDFFPEERVWYCTLSLKFADEEEETLFRALIDKKIPFIS